MSAVWNPSTVPTGEPVTRRRSDGLLAAVVVFAAVLFNLVLCFVNTTCSVLVLALLFS